MMLTKEELNKLIEEKEKIRKQMEVLFYKVEGQIDLLKDMLKKVEEPPKA